MKTSLLVVKKVTYLCGLLGIFFFSTVALALAAESPGEAQARAFVEDLNRVILFPLIGLLMGVALLVFFLGCAQYVMGAANPAAREQGVKNITYGIIGMVVMVSAWAILTIVAGTFGLGDNLEELQGVIETARLFV